MTLSRKNSIVLDTQNFGVLELIKNKIFCDFDELMTLEQAELSLKSGYFLNEPMPFPFLFSPPLYQNDEILANLQLGQRLGLMLDDELVGHIDVKGLQIASDELLKKSIFKLNNSLDNQNLVISGEFEIYNKNLSKIKDEILKLKKERNLEKISAIMLTADPFNRAHERLVRMAIDKSDLLIICLAQTSSDIRLPYKLKKKILEYFIENYLPSKSVIVIPFENTNLFSSHLNPILECLAANKLGANKLIIGQNHNGLGIFLSKNKVHTILDTYINDLKMDLVVIPNLVYCDQCKTLVSTKTCPHGQHHHIGYHPEIIKTLLFKGILPPAILVRSDISSMILSELFPKRFNDIQKLCDGLFPNSGLLENKNDKDFYQELMKLYQTSSLT